MKVDMNDLLDIELNAVKEEQVFAGALFAANEFLSLPKVNTTFTQLTHIGAWTGEYAARLQELLPFKTVNLSEPLEKPALLAKAERILLNSDRERNDNSIISYLPGYSRVTTEVPSMQSETKLVEETVPEVKRVSEFIVAKTTWFSPTTFLVISTGRVGFEFLLALLSSKFYPGIIQIDIYRRNCYPGILREVASYGYTVCDDLTFEDDDICLTATFSRVGRSTFVRQKKILTKACQLSKYISTSLATYHIKY